MQTVPRVTIFTLGGTIASVADKRQREAVPRLSASQMLSTLPGLAELATVDACEFLQIPSPQISLTNIVELVAAARNAVQDGSRGVVITQGTDTLEETSFLFDLQWNEQAPAVFTGAMRNPSLPGADGPANLLAAIQVAASERSRRIGTTVVFNDEIHLPRLVRKTHTTNPAAFSSPAAGPIGWLSEGNPVFTLRPTPRPTYSLPPDTSFPSVALVRLALGDDAPVLRQLHGLGYSGVVLETFGGGHATPTINDALGDIVADLPVVLASRTGAGETLTHTYGFDGSEVTLLKLGLIPAGSLDGLKARLLLSVLLARNATRQEIDHAFRQF